MESDITVLVVTGDRARGRRCASRLRSTYDVERAGTVAEALARLEEAPDAGVEVVLVDGELPDGPPEAVARAAGDGGAGARAAVFVDGVPGTDVAERGFDEYLVTPAAADELQATVGRLADLGAYTTKVRESAELATERARIATTEKREPSAAHTREHYSAASDRLESLEREIRSIGSRFGATDYRAAFRDVGKDS